VPVVEVLVKIIPGVTLPTETEDTVNVVPKVVPTKVAVVGAIDAVIVAAVVEALAQPRMNCPRKSGKLNVVEPSPTPYTVLIAENNSV
jgi:hypothetical protein